MKKILLVSILLLLTTSCSKSLNNVQFDVSESGVTMGSDEGKLEMNEKGINGNIKGVGNVEMTDSGVNLSGNGIGNIQAGEDGVKGNVSNIGIDTKNINVGGVKIDKNLLDTGNIDGIDNDEFFKDDSSISNIDNNDNSTSQTQGQSTQSNGTMQINGNSMSNGNMQQN